MSPSRLRKNLILILILMLFGCRRGSPTVDEASEIQVDLIVEPSPPIVGEAFLELYMEDAQGYPIEGATLVGKGDMTHAGMAPVLWSFEEEREGVYRASFKWTMGGDWILTITGTLPDGRRLIRTFNFAVNSKMN